MSIPSELPMLATSHDFLIAFFPDHELHTIIEVNESTKPHLTFLCSCGNNLGVHDKQLDEMNTTASQILKKGPLRNCIIKPTFKEKR